jgi:exosome complex RNA-binding protein Rrp42 (RNase PH superfamily)
MLTKRELRISKMLSLEWLGQTLASLCWIISVFVYGIDSTGDWLQLGAASCWMLSNIATIVTINPEKEMNNA